jgi:hypothetical protein
MFGSKDVMFRISPNPTWHQIAKDKLMTVAKTKPPANVKEVLQFFGLCNFFSPHIQNFTIISASLTQLTKNLSKEAEATLQTLK